MPSGAKAGFRAGLEGTAKDAPFHKNFSSKKRLIQKPTDPNRATENRRAQNRYATFST
jgi:hypothetical protein